MALDSSEVLAGALRLLDEVGLDALTMRRLAQALGVQAGAIYWHFADKQQLYDAMIDQLMAGLLEPPPSGTWDAQLAELAHRLTRALSRHRDAARLATLGLRPGPNGLALSEAMLGVMLDAGFDAKTTLWATSVLGYFVLGYVIDVQALQAAKARGLDSVLRSMEQTLDRVQHPHLHEISARGLVHMTKPRELQARFEFGLNVIIDGFKATRAGTPAARRPRASSKGRRRR